ncbi:hypothetical protein [Niveispirillum sp. KHB5.9]|uniref:hypothetical protein n=1 Tax=Niveispirillum sp. KHB5.9 TaxID=3400269 RepID=UPI003A891AAF
MAGDTELRGLTIALRQELSVGLEEVLYDSDRWMRAQSFAEGIGDAVAAGADPAGIAAMLDGLPPPRNARERVMGHLLRAGMLRDGAAPTAAITALIDDLADPGSRHSLAQADYILRAIVFAVWTNRMRVADAGAHDLALRRLWHLILEKYRALMPARPPVPAVERQRDLIVLMVGQFMRGMHQPSLDTLDFVSKLVLRFGRRVVLVNTADGPSGVHYPYLGRFTSSVDDGLVAQTQLVIDRQPVPFIHLPPGFTDPEMAAVTRDRILALKPDLVLSFGTLNPVADLCRGLLDVVAIPFGTYLPMAEPAYVGLPRALTAGDIDALAAAGLEASDVIPIHYAYELPAAGTPRSRADLGLPTDAIVTAIIGLRLEQEVTRDFACALDGLIRAEPRLFFLFVGRMGDHAALCAGLPHLAARSRVHGYDPDVLSVLPACDLYLNPPRGGGGASAAYALAKGVPAHTLGFGDVANVVGPGFHLVGLADFADAARHFADDPAHRADRQAKARARFAEISSRQAMLRQILDGVKAMRARG